MTAAQQFNVMSAVAGVDIGNAAPTVGGVGESVIARLLLATTVKTSFAVSRSSAILLPRAGGYTDRLTGANGLCYFPLQLELFAVVLDRHVAGSLADRLLGSLCRQLALSLELMQ